MLHLTPFVLACSLLQEPAATPAAPTLDAATRARYEAAARYSEALGGTSLLVCDSGRVVFEAYAEGTDAETPHRLASGTKSFWGVLAIAAVEDELFTLDEKVAGTLVEWQDDPLRSQIRVRDLLDLSSGLPAAKLRLDRARDKYAAALAVPAARPAGEAFEYGPTSYYCFGEFLRRKLEPKSLDPLEYLHARLLDPIGLEVAAWKHDAAGHPHIPNGASLTAREWAKFGVFLLAGGRVGERQLIPSAALATCFEPSPTNPSYGLTFWLGVDAEESLALSRVLDPRRRDKLRQLFEARRAGRGANIPDDLRLAAGKGKQRLYLLPTLDLVIVRQGESDHAWSDLEFLELLLTPSAGGR